MRVYAAKDLSNSYLSIHLPRGKHDTTRTSLAFESYRTVKSTAFREYKYLMMKYCALRKFSVSIPVMQFVVQ